MRVSKGDGLHYEMKDYRGKEYRFSQVPEDVMENKTKGEERTIRNLFDMDKWLKLSE